MVIIKKLFALVFKAEGFFFAHKQQKKYVSPYFIGKNITIMVMRVYVLTADDRMSIRIILLFFIVKERKYSSQFLA